MAVLFFLKIAPYIPLWLINNNDKRLFCDFNLIFNFRYQSN